MAKVEIGANCELRGNTMRTANSESSETGPRSLTTLSVVRETGRMLSQAAKFRDMTIPDFMEQYLRPAIVREYRAAINEAAAGAAGLDATATDGD